MILLGLFGEWEAIR